MKKLFASCLAYSLLLVVFAFQVEAQTANLDEERCSKGDEDRCISLYGRLIQGDGVKKNYSAAKAIARELCDNNSGRGCGLLSRFQNKKELQERADFLLRKECSLAFAASCNALANMYYVGDFRNYEAAVPYYELAAKYYKYDCANGDGAACAAVGFMLSGGNGIREDDEASTEFYRKACELNSGYGCIRLGWLYANGSQGVEKDDYWKGLYWRKGCELGVTKSFRGVCK